MIDHTPSFPFVFIVVAIFVLLSIFLEWKRGASKSRRVLRMVAVIGLGVGLLAVILKPKTTTNSSSKTVVYLTEGYNNKLLDSLVKIKPDLKIYAKHTTQNKYRKVVSINHINYLEKAIDTLFVLGFGLEKEERERQSQFHLKYLPSYPSGIIGIDYPKDLIVGDSAWVVLYTKFDSISTVSVTSFDGNIDSSIVAMGYDTAYFKISAKIEGEQLIEFFYQNAGSPIVEKLGIRVHPAPIYNILILNEYPSFETRYLKKWLGTAGHQLTVRNKVSSKKYRYEYINTLPVPFNGFNASYDLIILDSRSLTNSSKRQIENLRLAINNGANLLLQADDDLLTNKDFKSWFIAKSVNDDKYQFKATNLPRLPYQLLPSRLHTSVVSSGHQVLVQKRVDGEGVIAVSLVTATYPLVLQGHHILYDKYWKHIINSIVSIDHPLTKWSVQENIPIKNHPVSISLVTTIDNPLATVDSAYFPLIQNINYTNQWDATIWPDSTGWMKLSILQDSIGDYWEYIYPKDAWKNLKNFERVKETSALLNQTTKSSENISSRVEISMWYWYGLMMLALLFLWIEPKL